MLSQESLQSESILVWVTVMKVIVATKVSGYSERLSYLRKSGKPVRVDEENILEGVENSLQRLGIDYIDLLQIHWYVSSPRSNVFMILLAIWRVHTALMKHGGC